MLLVHAKPTALCCHSYEVYWACSEAWLLGTMWQQYIQHACWMNGLLIEFTAKETLEDVAKCKTLRRVKRKQVIFAVLMHSHSALSALNQHSHLYPYRSLHTTRYTHNCYTSLHTRIHVATCHTDIMVIGSPEIHGFSAKEVRCLQLPACICRK